MFKFRLVGADGTSVEPDWFTSSEPNWGEGDRAFIRPGLAYRVVRVDLDSDDHRVLVVERDDVVGAD